MQCIPFVTQMSGNVSFFDRWIVERIEVVHHRNAPTLVQETIHEVAANETRPTRYQRVPLVDTLTHTPITAETGRCAASTYTSGRPMLRYVKPAARSSSGLNTLRPSTKTGTRIRAASLRRSSSRYTSHSVANTRPSASFASS